MMNARTNLLKEAAMTSQTNIDKENNFVKPRINQLKEATFVTINAKNLNFYSDKQWEEYDILTNLDGYELDYQDNSSGWIKVVKLDWFEVDSELLRHKMVSDIIHIHKDGRIEHV